MYFALASLITEEYFDRTTIALKFGAWWTNQQIIVHIYKDMKVYFVPLPDTIRATDVKRVMDAEGNISSFFFNFVKLFDFWFVTNDYRETKLVNLLGGRRYITL